MGGAASRRKGHNFERWVAGQLRDLTGLKSIRRGWQARDGHDAPDVICPGFWIECKRCKQVNIHAAMEQAERDADGRMMPVAVTKRDGGPVLVTMLWEDWVTIAREEMVEDE